LVRCYRFHQGDQLTLDGLVLDLGVGPKQTQAKRAVQEQQAFDFPSLAVAIVENVTGTSSTVAICCRRAAPTRLTPFSYFRTCWKLTPILSASSDCEILCSTRRNLIRLPSSTSGFPELRGFFAVDFFISNRSFFLENPIAGINARWLLANR
jgi:hypothetical protein